MSFAVSSGLEILQVHGSPLDMHFEKRWLDLKGKKKRKCFSINWSSLIFILNINVETNIFQNVPIACAYCKDWCCNYPVW